MSHELHSGQPGGTIILPPEPSYQIIKPTIKRYLILFLFCLNTGNKAFQWIQVPASTNKATIFYGVEHYVINFASIIFMLSFIVVSWPACYIIQRIGVRNSILGASFGTILGSIVKCYSCSGDHGITLLLLGQVIISLSEQLVHQVPTRLASVWFPDHQVASCFSICVFGNQLGVAIGFLVPQWLMQDAFTREEIGERFYQMFLLTLIYSTVLFVANLLMFSEAPAHAPGLARQNQIAVEKEAKRSGEQDESMRNLFKQVRQLYRNRDLVLIALSFGMAVGRSDAISTLLDQTIRPLYPNDHMLVGNVGFLIVIAGALGLPVWGRALDAFHAYKMINASIAVCTSLALALFAYVLIYLKLVWAIYLAAALFGFFQSGFFVANMDFAVELTYPASEILTSSIMFIKSALLGPLFILIGSYIVDNYGALPTILFHLSTVIASLLCILLTRERLKRQEAVAAQENMVDTQNLEIL